MIFVDRNSVSKPEILIKNEKAWKFGIANAQTDAERRNHQAKYKHIDIKNALIKLFEGKCAYCESKILHIDFGDIEHYRPKSLPEFYELAIEWQNLLLSCGKCNNNKLDKFPLTNENEPIINPCEDEPNHHFIFEFDTITKKALVFPLTSRGEMTENLLELNRPGLRDQRSGLIEKLIQIAKMYHNDGEAKEIIDKAASNDSEFSAFAKVVRQKIFEIK